MLNAAKLNEAGYEEAVLGFGMAMKPQSAVMAEWWTEERRAKVEKTALANAGRGKGHDKFLRMIQTWWHLDMPRFLSQEFATYKIGTTTSSSSTMHRICAEPVTIGCFDTTDLNPEDITAMHILIDRINKAVETKELLRAKQMLPEGYMLEQIWNGNYAVINCIIQQRHNHRLAGWQELIAAFHEQLDHPELLMKGDK